MLKTKKLFVPAARIVVFILLLCAVGAQAQLPKFEYKGVAIDPKDTKWPGSKDLISPVVINAANIFEKPLAKYYLYTGPHDHADDNGIGLYVSDSLDGPWKLYGPVVGDRMAAVHVIWSEEEKLLYLFAHLPPVNRNFYCTSKDGIHFSEKKKIDIKSHGYGKVYRYTLPGHDNKYIFVGWNGALYGNWKNNKPQRFMSSLWKSDNLKSWTLVDQFRYDPRGTKHHNCGSPFYVQYGGKQYVLFEGGREGYEEPAGVEIWGYEVDKELKPIRDIGTVMSFEVGNPQEKIRVGPGFVYQERGKLYLFYSQGPRLGQRIAYAVAGIGE